MKCPRCDYGWESKVPHPKECPRCKARLDYKLMGALPLIEKKGGEKLMTSKLPWTTAAVLIVAAVAVGAWAVFGVSPVPTDVSPSDEWSTQAATISIGDINWLVSAGSTPSESGIENVFFMVHVASADGDNDGYDNMENLAEHENIQTIPGENSAVLESSGDEVKVPYDNYFDIVVTFKVHKTQVYDVRETDNFTIHIVASGAVVIDENTNSTNMFCIENSSPDTDWGRWNAVFNNDGAGFTLVAGSNFTIDNIDLYGWI